METGVGKWDASGDQEEEISLSLWFCPHSVGPSMAGRMLSSLSAHFDEWENCLRFGKWLGKKEKVNPG